MTEKTLKAKAEAKAEPLKTADVVRHQCVRTLKRSGRVWAAGQMYQVPTEVLEAAPDHFRPEAAVLKEQEAAAKRALELAERAKAKDAKAVPIDEIVAQRKAERDANRLKMQAPLPHGTKTTDAPAAPKAERSGPIVTIDAKVR